MKHYKSIDIFRALSLVSVLIYHFWVLTGYIPIENNVVYVFVKLGGEFGVTAFFLLSGFGIYNSLSHQDANEKVKYIPYLKRRLKRIYPEYLISILFVLLFMNGAYYISVDNIWHILVHILLVHNLFLGSHGSINGALWTMGVIFQFYLVSILLFKIVKRYGIYFVIISIGLTITSRYLVFNYFMDVLNFNESYFIAGRQLLTSLDNFVIGMYVAHLAELYNNLRKNPTDYLIVSLFLFLLFIVGNLGLKFGINTNNFSGYVWHSSTAIILGFMMFFATKIDVSLNIISRSLLFLSKYEYGIYLIHLVLISNILEKSSILISLVNQQRILGVFVILFLISVMSGYAFTSMVNGKKLFK